MLKGAGHEEAFYGRADHRKRLAEAMLGNEALMAVLPKK